MGCPTTANPRCFGALGDGIADDTTAIQNCLDDTFDNGGVGVGNGSVESPDAVYRITDTLNIHQASGSVSGLGNGTVFTWDGPNDRPMFKVTDSRWLTFKNLRLAGNDTTPPTYALEYVNEGGQAGTNEWLSVRDVVVGSWPWLPGGKVQNGIGFTGTNGNNDQMYLERVQISAEAAGVVISNSQSVWGKLTDVGFNGCETGIETHARTTLINPMFNANGVDIDAHAPVLVVGLNSENCRRLATLAPSAALVVKGGQFQVSGLVGPLIDAYPTHAALLTLEQVECAQPFDPASARIRFGPQSGQHVGDFAITVTDCRGLHPDMLESVDDYWASVPESQGSVEWKTTHGSTRYRFRNELRKFGRTTLDFDIWEYE